ncbi:ABC transporter permease [Anoxybacter fermentans]|uniref:ABC transporter permease n=1 Tax=Anoxybacter fermentans TaxID=1323375 RepID=UPI0013DFBD20|nr:ABC transporter permease [Anoxybacter fermentans]
MNLFNIFKAELNKYWIEIKTYYPDHIVNIIVTYIFFTGFFLGFRNNSMIDDSYYIGFLYWFFVSNVISEASVSISFEKQIGTLEQLILKPVSLEVICLVKTLVWLMITSIKAIILLLIIKLTLPINIVFDIKVVPILIITLTGLLGFSLLLAGLTLRFTKTASFESILSYILLFFTGAIVNIDNMPKLVRFISKTLPLTNGILISQRLINNESVSISQIFSLCLNSLLYLVVGILLFKYINKKSKTEGIYNEY